MSPPHTPCLLLFVRAPVRGQVKTRLAAELGADAALAIYRRLAEHALGEARRLAPGVRLRVLYTPAGAEAEVRRWLGEGVEYRAQVEGDLGARMAAAFDDAFADGYRRVLVVGSDLPGLSAALLQQALDALGESEVVLGPALDGGYYLLGLTRPMPALFHEVPWSTPAVLACTLERMAGEGVEPVLLEPLGDVDEAADLPAGWMEGGSRAVQP